MGKTRVDVVVRRAAEDAGAGVLIGGLASTWPKARAVCPTVEALARVDRGTIQPTWKR